MATVLYGVSKQSSEKFYISAEFRKVLEPGETIVLGSSTIVVIDKDDTDVSSTLIEAGTKSVDGTTLKARLQAGSAAASPYKVTFLVTTSSGNVWEVDLEVEVAEI